MPRYKCDVLVVGGGAAGLRAALAAREESAQVLLVEKGCLGWNGVTANAYSDRMAFHVVLPQTPPGGNKSRQLLAADIYELGGKVSDEDLAEILAFESAEAFFFLEKLGVPWARRDDGTPDQFLTDASTFPRACHCGPWTARFIEAALVRAVQATDVEVLERVAIVSLWTCGGAVCGATGVDLSTGASVEIEAGAVVLATGGAGEVFWHHVYPNGMTGDGYALAFRAGAELVNMEFIQIGLCSVQTKLACSGDMMRALPRIVNDKGEEILLRYIEELEMFSMLFEKGTSWPISAEKRTHLIDVVVAQEVNAGKKVYLDYNKNPSGFALKKLSPYIKEWYASRGLSPSKLLDTCPLDRLRQINPQAVQWLKERGIDLEKGAPVEVTPAAQHFMGGIKIREKANSNVLGLYAAGECAGGQHGANRPGGTSLLDTQVFGRIAGRQAARWAMSRGRGRKIKGPVLRWEWRPGRIPAGEARREIQRLMTRQAGVIRTEPGLKQALCRIKQIHEEGIRPDDKGLVYALETENILIVAETILLVASMRQESRGSHLYFVVTEDGSLQLVPRNDAQWSKYIVIFRRDDQARLKVCEPVRKRR